MPAPFPDGDLDRAVELGAVDSQSVRIWVRQSGTAAVQAALSVVGQPVLHGTVVLSAATDWTGALSLSLPSPAPGAPFTCRVGDHSLQGRLAPAPADHS